MCCAASGRIARPILNTLRHSSEEERSKAAKRELAILAEAFQRYDGDASGVLDGLEIEKALEDRYPVGAALLWPWRQPLRARVSAVDLLARLLRHRTLVPVG